MGLLGDDADGHFLTKICDDMGIERSALEIRSTVKTARTLAMTAIPTGKRTFFYSAGAHATQTPDDFDFSKTSARIAHLGLPGLHEKLDAPWKDDVSGWVADSEKGPRRRIESQYRTRLRRPRSHSRRGPAHAAMARYPDRQ